MELDRFIEKVCFHQQQVRVVSGKEQVIYPFCITRIAKNLVIGFESKCKRRCSRRMLDNIWRDRYPQHVLRLPRLKFNNVEGELTLDMARTGKKNLHRCKQAVT